MSYVPLESELLKSQTFRSQVNITEAAEPILPIARLWNKMAEFSPVISRLWLCTKKSRLY